MVGLKQDITNVRKIEVIYAEEIDRQRDELSRLKRRIAKQKQRLDAAHTELHDAKYQLEQRHHTEDAEATRASKRSRSTASETDFQNDASFNNMITELKSVLERTGKVF